MTPDEQQKFATFLDKFLPAWQRRVPPLTHAQFVSCHACGRLCASGVTVLPGEVVDRPQVLCDDCRDASTPVA